MPISARLLEVGGVALFWSFKVLIVAGAAHHRPAAGLCVGRVHADVKRSAWTIGDTARQGQRAAAHVLVGGRVAERDAYEVSRRSGRVRLEHLGSPEVAAPVERARGDRAQATRPNMRAGGQEVFLGVGVYPIHMRLPRPKHKEVGDEA